MLRLVANAICIDLYLIMHKIIRPKLPVRNKVVSSNFYLKQVGFKVIGEVCCLGYLVTFSERVAHG